MTISDKIPKRMDRMTLREREKDIFQISKLYSARWRQHNMDNFNTRKRTYVERPMHTQTLNKQKMQRNG